MPNTISTHRTLRNLRNVLAITTLVAAVGVTSACELDSPFEGPGFSLSDGLTTDADGPFVAATTQLILTDTDGAQQSFDDHMAVLNEAIKNQPGLVGVAFGLPIFTDTGYRTLTVWETEEDMINWVISDAHLAAMEDFAQNDYGDSDSAVATWSIAAEEMPPTWDDARAHLEKDGRKVY